MKAVLITGATGGLGRSTAVRFAEAGWHVVVGGRRPEAVDGQVRELEAAGGRASGFVADLGSLEQIRAALSATSWPTLRGIVACAGTMSPEQRASADGYELTFAVNVLSHQLIVARLLERLEPGGRIVFVSSGTHLPDHKLARRAGIPAPRWLAVEQLVDPDVVVDHFSDVRQAYTTSKLANVLQGRAFQAHLRATGRDVDVFAVDPGAMPATNLMRNASPARRLMARTVGSVLTHFVDGLRRPETSALHVFDLVTAPSLHGTGFEYFDGDKPHPLSDDGNNDAYRDALWRDANRLVGVDGLVAG